MDSYLFIAGIEKCGTTSLAHWFVENGLANYLYPGLKEPGTYSAGDRSDLGGLTPPGVLLDATVSYARNPRAIARMPERNTRIILCLRNQFERCQSAYAFNRAIAERGDDSQQLWLTMPGADITSSDERYPDKAEILFESLFDFHKQHHASEEVDQIRSYWCEEADNICQQTLKERIEYEIGFFLSRYQFPFFSVLAGSSFFGPLKNLLQKYHPQKIFLVTLDQLDDEAVRRDFAQAVLGSEAQRDRLPPLSKGLNSTRGLSVNSEPPDFAHRDWDSIRAHFLQDWRSLEVLAEEKGVSMRYVTTDKMEKFLVPPKRPSRRVAGRRA
jgi:hypothetical protein